MLVNLFQGFQKQKTNLLIFYYCLTPFVLITIDNPLIQTTTENLIWQNRYSGGVGVSFLDFKHSSTVCACSWLQLDELSPVFPAFPPPAAAFAARPAPKALAVIADRTPLPTRTPPLPTPTMPGGRCRCLLRKHWGSLSFNKFIHVVTGGSKSITSICKNKKYELSLLLFKKFTHLF